VRVDTKINYRTLDFSKPEIVESKLYREAIANIKSLLITVPKEFYDAKIILDTKDIEKTGTLLKSDYSIWLTEIERLLTKNGFRVMAIQNMDEIIRQKQPQKTEQTASPSGVDAIIQINSLEYYGWNEISQMATKEMSFYSSNSRGDKKNKVYLDEDSTKEIETIAKEVIRKDIPLAFKALLDLKIINAKTNEVIWYYRNNFCHVVSGNNETEQWFLVAKYSGPVRYSYQIVEPQVPFFRQAKKEKKLYDKKTLYETETKTDEKEQRLQIIRMICEDFIKEFNKNN
jgi:hypothetical protein